MASSPIIEYLQSLRESGDTLSRGPLLRIGVQQIIVSAFPPSTRVQYDSSPLPVYKATIGYRTTAVALPNAFTLDLRQGDSLILSGVLTGDVIADGTDYLFISTERQHLYTTITNNHALYQRWESNSYFLGVLTYADIETVYRELDRVHFPAAVQATLDGMLRTLEGILRGGR